MQYNECRPETAKQQHGGFLKSLYTIFGLLDETETSVCLVKTTVFLGSGYSNLSCIFINIGLYIHLLRYYHPSFTRDLRFRGIEKLFYNHIGGK